MTQPESRSSAEERGAVPNVLALDLGGTHLRTAVATPSGRLIARRMTRTPRAPVGELLEACLAQLRESRAEAEATGVAVELLTISAPGPLNPQRGVIIDPPNMHPSLWDFPLAPRLGQALGLPALLERDTQVAALAEGMFGSARGLTDYVYLTVSTGVGGGVVSAGRLLRGPDGVAGELGHLTIDMDGPECGCGARGHLEALASGTGIAAAARRAFRAGEIAPSSPLGRLAAERGEERLSGRTIDAAEAEGDPLAAAIMDRARRAFAAAMVSIVDIFNPQRVIVGGGVAAGQGERLLAPARQLVAEHAFRVQARRAEIVPAGLADDVGLLGGIGLALLQPPGAGPTSEQGEMGAGQMALTQPTGVEEHWREEREQRRAASAG